ncbi:MAG: MraY family glycosyltransferase [Vulcanibacillus sp.]
MSSYILPFDFAFLTVLILVPILSRVAFKLNFVDLPNIRKTHKGPVPLLGGLAIYLGYMITMFLCVDDSRLKTAIIISSTLIVSIGLIDDYYKSKKKDFSSLPKIIIQIIVAVILYSFGIKITGISSIFDGGMIFFSAEISLVVTLIWVVSLMNMINFLDGADGLAGGIAIISSMTLFLISYVKGLDVISLLSIILMGTTIGFLLYNFYPARIYMGDTGSVFLGLMLAIISIEGALKSATLLSIMMVIFVFGVPIFDTIIVFFNRWKNHKPLYTADRTHVHHRLLKKGYSIKQTVGLIYIVSLIFSVVSIGILVWIMF